MICTADIDGWDADQNRPGCSAGAFPITQDSAESPSDIQTATNFLQLRVALSLRLMRAWSIPIGKFLGTEVRLHLTFLLLLALVVTQTMKVGIAARRGVAIFFIVLGAVLIHEAARALFTRTKRDKTQRLVLLPIGGVILGETSDRAEKQTSVAQEARSALAGPIAALLTSGIVAGYALGIAKIDIFASPYIHSSHLLQSTVWITAGLGLLNLVPAYPLAAGRVLRVWLARNASSEVPDPWQEATRKSVSYGQGFATVLTIMGLIAGNVWAMLVGFCVFVAAHLEDRSLLFQSVVSSVRMEEIMLTDFSVLSPADTLHD